MQEPLCEMRTELFVLHMDTTSFSPVLTASTKFVDTGLHPRRSSQERCVDQNPAMTGVTTVGFGHGHLR